MAVAGTGRVADGDDLEGLPARVLDAAPVILPEEQIPAGRALVGPGRQLTWGVEAQRGVGREAGIERRARGYDRTDAGEERVQAPAAADRGMEDAVEKRRPRDQRRRDDEH